MKSYKGIIILMSMIPTMVLSQPAIGVKISTLGVGIEIQNSISEKSTIRLGYYGASPSKSLTESGMEYDASFKARNTLLAIDYYLGSTPFRVSAGLVKFSNSIDLVATPTGAIFNINGTDYDSSLIDSLSGNLGISGSMPYIGIGVASTPEDEGFGFSLDLGASTVPDVSASLSVTCSAAATSTGVCSGIESAVVNESSELQNDFNEGFSNIGLYPVISTGISYKF